MLCNANFILNKGNVIQFNINNLEWTKYILEECDRLRHDVILGVSENAIKYMGGVDTVFSMVNGLIRDLNISISVCLHLDHGKSFDICKKCIDVGFSSVMIDGSMLSFEDNVSVTKKVVDYASLNNVSVEGEIGLIGGSKPSIDDICNFVSETGISMVAFPIGTVHGYGKINIDFDFVRDVKKAINVPIVLHGGSGVDDEIIKKLLDLGVSKVNINTDLQFAWSCLVRQFLNNNLDVYDPRLIIGSGEAAIKEVVRNKCNLL